MYLVYNHFVVTNPYRRNVYVTDAQGNKVSMPSNDQVKVMAWARKMASEMKPKKKTGKLKKKNRVIPTRINKISERACTHK